MEVSRIRKTQCIIECAGEEDNADGTRAGWEDDSESRKRKQQRSEA